MRFKINNRTWTIKEVSQEKMREVKEDSSKENYYYGVTEYSSQTIYIWNGLHNEQKRQTLIHELVHCYMGVYGSFQTDNVSMELMCDLVGNMHDIINEVVNKYFK